MGFRNQNNRRSKEKAQARWVLLGLIQATSLLTPTLMVHRTEKRICQGFHLPSGFSGPEIRGGLHLPHLPPVHLPWLRISLSCYLPCSGDTQAPDLPPLTPDLLVEKLGWSNTLPATGILLHSLPGRPQHRPGPGIEGTGDCSRHENSSKA